MTGSEIRLLRRQRRWTQMVLAVKTGVGLSTIVKLETGVTQKASPLLVEKLRAVFGLTEEGRGEK